MEINNIALTYLFSDRHLLYPRELHLDRLNDFLSLPWEILSVKDSAKPKFSNTQKLKQEKTKAAPAN